MIFGNNILTALLTKTQSCLAAIAAGDIKPSENRFHHREYSY